MCRMMKNRRNKKVRAKAQIKVTVKVMVKAFLGSVNKILSVVV